MAKATRKKTRKTRKRRGPAQILCSEMGKQLKQRQALVKRYNRLVAISNKALWQNDRKTARKCGREYAPLLKKVYQLDEQLAALSVLLGEVRKGRL